MSKWLCTWFRSLRIRFLSWIVSRLVAYAFDQLEDVQLGTRLNQLMDDRFGPQLSNPAQKRMAKWLRTIAKELEA